MVQKAKTVVERDFPKNRLNRAINMLVYGTRVNKMTGRGKGKHEVIFYIDEDNHFFLQWLSDNKPLSQTRVDLTGVKRIAESPSFKINKSFQEYDDLMLAITYGNDDELVLVFEDREDKDLWWQGLQHFYKLANREEHK
jgi:hypothetical protein